MNAKERFFSLTLLIALGVGCQLSESAGPETGVVVPDDPGPSEPSVPSDSPKTPRQDPNRLAVVFGTRQEILELAISPDGALALVSGEDNSVKLWDLRAGLEIRSYRGHGAQVNSIQFSPDGQSFASASDDGTARVWDLASGRVLRVLEHGDATALSVAYHPNGLELAVGEYDSSEVHIWSLVTGKEVRTITGQPCPVVRLEYRGPGDELHAFSVNGNWDNNHSVWDTSTGEALERHSGHGETSPQLSPDGKLSAVLMGDVVISDTKTEDERLRIEVERGWDYQALQFSVDGRFLVGGAVDIGEYLDDWPAKLTLWDATTGERIRSFQAPGFYGRKLGRMISMGLTADGIRLVAAGEDSVHVWSLSTGQLLSSIHPRGTRVRSTAVSPDGTRLATSANENIRLWDLKGNPEVLTLRGHKRDVLCLDIRNDGRLLASGSVDGALQLWDLTTGELESTLVEAGNAVYAVQFLSGERGLLAKFDDGRLVRWDLETGTEHDQVEFTHQGWAMAARANLGFALASSSSTVYKVDLKSKQMEAKKVFATDGAHLTSVAISPDGKMGACGGGHRIYARAKLHLFDIASGKELHELKGHELHMDSLAFSPDGRVLASASSDGQVRLWDTSTGRCLSILEEHSAGVSYVSYSRDGKRLITSGEDGRAIVWNVESLTPLMTFLVLDDEDWAMVREDNYYWASLGALTSIGFRQGLSVSPFEQFDLVYHRPDLVVGTLGVGDPERTEMYRAAYRKRIEKMDLGHQVESAGRQAPNIAILNRAMLPFEASDRNLILQLKASDASLPIDRMNVWVNGVPVHGRNGLRIEGARRDVERDVALVLSPGNNKIQVSALNVGGVESLRETIQVVYAGPSQPPELHVLSIGVSEYVDSQYNLVYAAKDATDLSAAFGKGSSPFAKVHVSLLTDGTATREAILAQRRFLMESRVEDTVLVFYAGHGVLDPSLDYYLATNDMEFEVPSSRGLPYDSLEELLDGIPARHKLILIDACHSGEVDKESMDFRQTLAVPEGQVTGRGIQVVGKRRNVLGLRLSFELMKELFADLRRGTGAVVISSAGGAEFALESDAWHNGVFTYSVLEGLLENKADTDGDGHVLVSELRDHVIERVRTLTEGKQTPTARRVNLELDFTVH